jgi:predicted tellurium resistance membrane protein TerC
VHEIHHKVVGTAVAHRATAAANFRGVLVSICLMDLVFSIDSVITAVGMVNAEGENFMVGISVMIAAVMIAVGVMMIFAEPVSRFVEANPSLKMLALSFLILIGVMLVAEGIGTHFNKGYIYFAMAFALAVEGLNLRSRKSHG